MHEDLSGPPLPAHMQLLNAYTVVLPQPSDSAQSQPHAGVGLASGESGSPVSVPPVALLSPPIVASAAANSSGGESYPSPPQPDGAVAGGVAAKQEDNDATSAGSVRSLQTNTRFSGMRYAFC